jgi:hypothetical protein
MNIEEAITEFEAQHQKKYSTKDQKKILEVVSELGITEFTVTKDHISNIKTGTVNLANEIGIHSTMIVAGLPFAGSEFRPYNPDAKNGEFKGYKHRTQHFGLEGWIDVNSGPKETGGTAKVNCGGVMVPVGSECAYCGVVH